VRRSVRAQLDVLLDDLEVTAPGTSYQRGLDEERGSTPERDADFRREHFRGGSVASGNADSNVGYADTERLLRVAMCPLNPKPSRRKAVVGQR
jgi:hypothetical protein